MRVPDSITPTHNGEIDNIRANATALIKTTQKNT